MPIFSFPPDGGIPNDSSRPGDDANDFNSTMLLLEEEGIGFLRKSWLDEAEEIFRKMEELAIAAGDDSWIASVRSSLGVVFTARGDFDGAEKMCREAIAIDEKYSNTGGLARDYANMAAAMAKRGDFDGAEAAYEKSLEFCRNAGLTEMLAGVYGNMGNIYKSRGGFAAAEKMYRDALAIYEEFGNREGAAFQYGNLGGLYVELKDFQAAEDMLNKAITIDEELGPIANLAGDRYNMGMVYKARGDTSGASEMFAAALDLYEILGNKEMAAAAAAELVRLNPPPSNDSAAGGRGNYSPGAPRADAKKSAFAKPEKPPVINTNKFPFEIEAERRRLEEAGRPKLFNPDKFGFWLEKFFDSLPAPHKTRPERPDTITVDFNTPFETFFSSAALACLIVASYLFLKGYFGDLSLRGFTSAPDPGVRAYALLAVIVSVAALAVRLYTDNYYFIDKTDRKIYFQFRCLSFEYTSFYLDGSQVEAVGVTGRPLRGAENYARRKSPDPGCEDGWEYCVCLVTKNGKIIKFGDFTSGGLSGLNRQAGALAEALDSRVVENPGRMVLCVDMAEDGPCVNFAGPGFSLALYFTANGLVWFVVFLAAFAAVMYAAYGR
ncbi:MAG: hypothetical protein A2008_02740 [Candidatus Wallbacteria bacterium GWC2_49_35]|uniref:MalT-like TPR region domain-containing protein n=1 Tax=Candidatus Wallbacteria bacterium GWC2_49_35 TaxID=1817813 RepID=A0A1F7WQA6_9BACT|nr:MAG: hypothetical protein A2008_02740 [Candidatus Wallbacteria bacterium GWC2_49_35]HBC76844.1 hypothetical protein [Candidatus Wallbacteria bacterium]